MSAQAGPGPSSSAYLQAQKQTGNHDVTINPALTAGNGGTPANNNPGTVLAPIGGTAETLALGEPNTFTDAQLEEFKEQDRYLPIANVGRIMKNALPSNAKIAKEAKECVQECVSEFISFLSSEAADKVGTDKRKTINGEDILYAMTALGFDNYQEAGRVYLAKYRNYINEHPHRPSHHERTVPPSAQTSNRNTPLQTPTITDDLLDPSSFLNQSPDEGFPGNFNAFVNDDADGPGDEDDEEDEDRAGSGLPDESNASGKGKPKKAPAGKKAAGGGAKRKAGATGTGPPDKKAKTKGAGAAATTAGKKGSKK